MSKIKRLDKIKDLLKEVRRQIRKYNATLKHNWLHTDLFEYDDDPHRSCFDASDRFDRTSFSEVIDHLLKQLEAEKNSIIKEK